MLKLYFFAVIDDLTESVVNIFYARNFEHAKMLVKNGLKDSKLDSDSFEHFTLVQISDLIEVVNDFDDIVKYHCNHLALNDSKIDYMSLSVLDILNDCAEFKEP